MKLASTSKMVIVVLMASGISGAYAESVMKAEFRSMAECLERIKARAGGELKVVTDKPTQVSGFLTNGQHFSCEKKETGTKGTYYEGWYTVK